MKKKKIILLILFILVLCALISYLIFWLLNRNSDAYKEDNSVIDNQVYNDIFKEYRKYYSSDFDYNLTDGQEKRILLSYLIKEYNFDVSILKKYSCNYETSYIQINIVEGEQKIGLYLDCN